MNGDDAELRAAFVMGLRGRGVRDARVLSALERTPRGEFLPPHHAEKAYTDESVRIEAGQMATQPFVVALAVHAAEVGERDIVLDVGSGTGYQAAVLARLARRVFTIERQEALFHAAKARLGRLRVENASCIYADGAKGWKPQAPFDRILVSASAREEDLGVLIGQLAPGGVMVAPVGGVEAAQTLTRFRKGADGEIEQRETLARVRFGPLGRGIASR